MGCKQSKLGGKIQPVGPASIRKDNTKRNRGEFDIDHNSGKKVRKTKSQNSKQFGSSVSLDDDRSIADSERGFSASSKISKKSTDSGLEADYAFVITEDSDPDKVRRIEEEFCADENLDLALTGVQCPTRTSAKDRERMEEAMILQSLRDEGLITRPHKETRNFVTFEVVSANASSEIIRPPPRLEKLERRRKKKKQLTEEEIKEKLERAERRKKKKEQERLAKIKDLEKTNTNSALEQFIELQRQKEDTVNKKLDTVAENREKQLQEKKERIKERERRAEKVRQRKQLALMENQGKEDENVIPRGNELEF